MSIFTAYSAFTLTYAVVVLSESDIARGLLNTLLPFVNPEASIFTSLLLEFPFKLTVVCNFAKLKLALPLLDAVKYANVKPMPNIITVKHANNITPHFFKTF